MGKKLKIAAAVLGLWLLGYAIVFPMFIYSISKDFPGLNRVTSFIIGYFYDRPVSGVFGYDNWYSRAMKAYMRFWCEQDEHCIGQQRKFQAWCNYEEACLTGRDQYQKFWDQEYSEQR